MGNCPYSAYLTYVKHLKGEDNIYGVLGGATHDALEKIVNNQVGLETLPAAITNSLEQAELLGLSFPKDRKGNDTIRDNWVADMEHFALYFRPPEGNFKTEEFLLYKIDEDNYIQGYADLIQIDDFDGKEQSIYDWKTSSMYSGEDLVEHGRQLIIYALAKEQQGIKVNEVAWYFLKYVTVKFMGYARSSSKNKTEIVKHISRRKLLQELEPYIRQYMMEVGYDDIEIEMSIMEAVERNSMVPLPIQVRENFTITPCKITYELNDETREECINWINQTIAQFQKRDKDDANQWEPRKFTKLSKMGREVEDTFFCTALCSYRNQCPHLEDYRETKRMLAEDIDQFI